MKGLAMRWMFGLLMLLPLHACSMTYRAEPIEAWVVDAESGQTIDGVVVTANWELERGTVGGSVPFGQIMVMEAVTDAKGRFYFPAWGPIATPVYVPVPLIESAPQLVDRDPQLLLFKSGYKWVGLANYPLVNYNTSSLRKSDWNGKTIKMEKFKGDATEYGNHLTSLEISMGYAFYAENCEWKQTPRMLALLFSEANSLRKRGIYTGVGGAATLPRQKECGSALEFLREYF